MKKYVIILLAFLLIGNVTSAQVQISEDPAVSNLLQRHIDQNKISESLSGWRIQLMATTNRRKVEEEEARFISRFPAINVFWEHSKPYYKLKAGAFATKLEATRVLQELKRYYPSAILTKSMVTYNEVLK